MGQWICTDPLNKGLTILFHGGENEAECSNAREWSRGFNKTSMKSKMRDNGDGKWQRTKSGVGTWQ